MNCVEVFNLVKEKSGIVNLDLSSREGEIVMFKKIVSYLCKTYTNTTDNELLKLLEYKAALNNSNNSIYNNCKVVHDWLSIKEDYLPRYFFECRDCIVSSSNNLSSYFLTKLEIELKELEEHIANNRVSKKRLVLKINSIRDGITKYKKGIE